MLMWEHVNTNKKKVWVAILISDKVDFRTRKIIMDKENTLWQRDQFLKKTWQSKMYIHLKTKVQNEMKIDWSERRYRQIHNHCWRLQCFSFKNWQNK